MTHELGNVNHVVITKLDRGGKTVWQVKDYFCPAFAHTYTRYFSTYEGAEAYKTKLFVRKTPPIVEVYV